MTGPPDEWRCAHGARLWTFTSFHRLLSLPPFRYWRADLNEPWLPPCFHGTLLLPSRRIIFFFQRNRLEPVVILSTIVSLLQEGSLRSTNSRCTPGYIVGTVIGSNLNFDDCDFGRVNFRGQIRMQKVIGRSPPPPLLHNTVEIVITVSNLDCTTMRVQQAARLIGLQVR